MPQVKVPLYNLLCSSYKSFTYNKYENGVVVQGSSVGTGIAQAAKQNDIAHSFYVVKVMANYLRRRGDLNS